MRRFFFIFLMLLFALISAIQPNHDHANLQAAPLPGGQPQKPAKETAQPIPTFTATPTITPPPASIQPDNQLTDEMATIAALDARDALCPLEKGTIVLTAIYCFGFDFNLSIRGPGGTTADEVHLFFVPFNDKVAESQDADDIYMKLDIHLVPIVAGQAQNESATNCQRQPAQHTVALNDASLAISRYRIVYTEYLCGEKQLLRKDLIISHPQAPTIRVTFTALPETKMADFDKLFAAFIKSFTFFNLDQPSLSITASLQPIVTSTPLPVTPITPSTLRATQGIVNPLPAPFYFLGQDQQIWHLARDGVSITQVTTESSPITDFDISPADGSLVYVVGGIVPGQPETEAQLLMTDAQGQNQKILPITSTVSTVRWSPDGKRIAYDSDEGIYVTALGGTPELRLAVENDSERYTVVSWSPNGALLLVDKWGRGPGWATYVFNLQDNSLVPLEQSCCTPLWSQDSSGIYFAIDALGEVWPGLWFVSATNGKAQMLVKSVNPQNDLLPWVSSPYTNTGTLYAFVGTTFESGWPFPLTLSQVHEDGTTTPLRSDAHRLQQALWAANGTGALIVADSNRRAWPPVGEIYWLGTGNEPAVALGRQGYKLQWGLK